MIMVGGGAVDAAEEIAQLAETAYRRPSLRTAAVAGSSARTRPTGCGLAAAYKAWADTDVLVAIGTRMELQYLRWRTFPPGLKIVRIDIDPRELVRRKATSGS